MPGQGECRSSVGLCDRAAVMTSVLIAPARSPDARSMDRTSPRPRHALATLSSRIYLPTLSIPVLAVALVAIGWSSAWGDAAFGGSLHSLRIVVIGPLALTVIGLILVVERVWPAQQRPFFARGHRHDLLIGVVHATLILPFVTALTLSFVEVVRSVAPWIVLPQMGTVPHWVAIALSSWPWTVATGRCIGPITVCDCSGASTSFTIPKKT